MLGKILFFSQQSAPDMRIFSKGTLRTFWEEYPDARAALEFWYDTLDKRSFTNPNEVIQFFNNADTVGNGRIVFNIARNKYRLIVKSSMSGNLFLSASLAPIKSMIN